MKYCEDFAALLDPYIDGELSPEETAFLKLAKEVGCPTMNGLGLPGVEVTAQPSVKCGITGTHVAVTVNGRTYTVPATVPCYNRETGNWVTLTEARMYAEESDLYVYQGVVRFIEVG